MVSHRLLRGLGAHPALGRRRLLKRVELLLLRHARLIRRRVFGSCRVLLRLKWCFRIIPRVFVRVLDAFLVFQNGRHLADRWLLARRKQLRD